MRQILQEQIKKMRKYKTVKLSIIALLGLSIIPIAIHTGHAAVAASGFAVSNFATGFTAGGFCCGPIGLAFDASGNLFVGDYPTGIIYKFGSTGGVASSTTQVNTVSLGTSIAGLTFTKDGHLYLARQGLGDVVELDPSTATVVRTVAFIGFATGIATDPLSGDLFVSGGAGISRISNFASGPGTVTNYASLGADGLAFGPDGTLYVASAGTCGGVAKVAGTNSAIPGSFTCIATVPTIDGMAVSANPGSHILFGNRNDGIITEVNFTSSPPTLTDITSGGSRGDFVTVGSDGCLYATQTSDVIKVTNADGSCLPPPLGPLFPPNPTSTLKVSKFFTDSSLNSLASDSNGNPMVDVVLASGIVRTTNPGQVVAWVNVTNISGSSLQSVKLNETLPVDWLVSPTWLPNKGAIHVFYPNTTSLSSNPDITQPSTITVSTGHPQTVSLSIPSFNATPVHHPLMPGQSILVSVKLSYGLIKTTQLPSSYPRNYTDTAIVVAWTQSSFMGNQFTGNSSAFFVADAKVVS